MYEFDKVLNKGEKILWDGKPVFRPYFMGSIGLVIFGTIFFLAGLVVFIMAIVTKQYLLLLFPHFWIGLGIAVGVPLYRYFSYKYIAYAITNKRVLIQKGIIGRDFDFVDYDQIRNVSVDVGFFDKVFGKESGTLEIYTGAASTYILENIQNPYQVTRFFSKVAYNVKTDMEYPNKYRPKKNPGYTTQLKK